MSRHVTIEVHSICWNEARMLPLFLSHYSRFATRIVVWDNHSDDASQDLVRACPRAELRLYDSGGQSSEDRFLEVKNRCWRSSDADWVIVCDVDELVYHPDIGGYLRESCDQVLQCDGFNLAGPLVPEFRGLKLWRGSFSSWYCKAVVFRPSLTDFEFTYGCHTVCTRAPVVGSRIKLLHGAFLGPAEDQVQRYRLLAARQSPQDVERGLGYHFRLPPDAIRARHRAVYETAYPFDVIDNVRRMQREEVTGEAVAAHLVAESIDPPRGREGWDAALVADVFGVP